MTDGRAAADGAAEVVASMHLQRVHGLGVATAIAHMATDRLALRKVDGLRFWKLLGTGDGRTFTPRDADPSTWGLFAVWDGAASLERFEHGHAVVRAWERRADEQWSAHLRPLRWRGRWSRTDPFDGALAAADDGGPVAALTRARVRASQWRSFWSAVPPVAAAIHATPGLRYTVGIGEAPVGLQATFSLWDSSAALQEFAYRGAEHRAVIDQTTTARWYAEELFARFAVIRTAGTIDGRSP